MTPDHLRLFRNDLLDWFEQAKRDMPWRQTSDPYRIWISEVMLQQTRVDQAWPYYERFVAAFPTIGALASASLDDVLRLWEGLGYYSRARHLHRAARMVIDTYEGRFPDTYDSIRTLPGIGPYTAAAVLSIAFGLPHAVLDGNVIRVLSRVFTVEDDIGAARTRTRLQHLAGTLLDPERPGDFNQALMELGATVCTPTSPTCPTCPLHGVCGAFTVGSPEAYPVKKKKAPVPHYDIAAGLIFNDEGHLLIQRRPEDKMLGGLWEFPGGKREPGESLEDTCRRELREELGIEVDILDPLSPITHAYSHFKITLYAFRCRIRSGVPRPRNTVPFRWVAVSDLGTYAFPRANRRLIDALIARRHNPSLFDSA
ncbi:MAG: A/G-specific adenine glycosylase [Rhodothermales bacterium]